MKVTIAKTLANRENVIVEIQGSRSQVLEELPLAFTIVDDRNLALNKRVLAFNPLFASLAKDHPKAAMLVHDLLAEITGQRVLSDEQYGVVAARTEEDRYDALVQQAGNGST